jgi:cellulase
LKEAKKNHEPIIPQYLGSLPTPDTKPQEVKFFKIKGDGFDKAQKKWANEEVLDNNRTDIVKIPSDIKPGMYIFRTELLALHGNSPSLPASFGGPQFYTHCFNVEILGNGNATPAGVKFPGAYQPNDPGVKFFLGQKDAWENYVRAPIIASMYKIIT